jgi:hypothetical protein
MAGIVAQTKQFVGESILGYRYARLQREKKVVNLMEAESIGLVYKVTNEGLFTAVKKLIKDLTTEKRQVMALGFVDDLSIPDYCVAAYSGYYFNRKDLNWYKAPKSDYITAFINKEYDILIDLSTSNDYILKYIIAMSRARFKVGRQRKGMEPFYDLMMRMKRSAHYEEYIGHALHYLTLLKSR